MLKARSFEAGFFVCAKAVCLDFGISPTFS